MNKEQKKMNNKGFSLVELIVVIAIMAILVGVLAPQYVRYVAKSRISTDMQNVQALKTAIEAYAAESGLQGNVVVKVNDSGNITVTATSDTGLAAAAGISTSTPLKGTWTGTAEYTLNSGNLQWTGTTDATASNNGKTYHMNAVFDASKQAETSEASPSPTGTP